MTWQAIALAAVVVAVVVPFAALGGWWLSRMAERTRSFWPLAVFTVAAFWFAVGVASVVAQLDLS